MLEQKHTGISDSIGNDLTFLNLVVITLMSLQRH